MKKIIYSDEMENYLADSVGNCFQESAKENYDSYNFAKEFLNSNLGESILKGIYYKAYNSFAYMLDICKDELNLKKGETYDSYLMWMYGFLVKFWITHYDIESSEIWKILPIDLFYFKFPFYHTQGWHYIIEDSTDLYNKKIKGGNK